MRHEVRKKGLEKLLLKGKIQGKGQRERQRPKYVDGQTLVLGGSAAEVLLVVDRIGRGKAARFPQSRGWFYINSPLKDI